LKLLQSTQQLGLWGDDDDLFAEPASLLSLPSSPFADSTVLPSSPLTAAVSPLAAPPLSSSSHHAAPDACAHGEGVPCPDDGPLPAGNSALRAPHHPHHECHPVIGLPWFRHPQGEHEIRLGKAVVSYEIKRARRRSIGMVVGVEGLSVRAPRWVSSTDIETALRAKERWICTKLVEQRERAQKQLSARIDWREGASVPYLGESVVLVLDPRVCGAVLQDAVPPLEPGLPGVAQRTLHLGLPQNARAEQIRDAVQSWLQRQALQVFLDRVPVYAGQLGVSVRKVSLSSAKTRWGSASADGSIRLHWRLIHFSISVIDYVVAHELAHLREMNHSPRFWDVVRSVMPEFDAPRDQLRPAVIPD
jgi:predicted metal-dependent hydrolase